MEKSEFVGVVRAVGEKKAEELKSLEHEIRRLIMQRDRDKIYIRQLYRFIRRERERIERGEMPE